MTVIGFVRDQPSYLNSHYTQHVKRFATAKSLDAYAAKICGHRSANAPTIRNNISGCSSSTHPSIRFFTYGRSITAAPSLGDGPEEPFAQLIHCLEIPETVRFKPVTNLNIQPGDLATRTSL